jgi:hypothetical protein
MTNQRQMDVKMVEIGIGILRAPPKDDMVVMRSWAIDVIEQSSGRKFNDEQRAVLLKQELVLRCDPMYSRAAEEAIKKINE